VRERAEEEAIRVFGRNLKDLLLAAPAGQHVTMGLDPGIRTGCKVAIVDATGKMLDTPPSTRTSRAATGTARLHHRPLAAKHKVDAGRHRQRHGQPRNRQAGADVIKRYPEARLTKIVVSEAGASVYSASEFAAKEFPDLDVSLRGAVSIARRLQDPLAELVKIDPKSIGVGQYQHDVSKPSWRALDAVVEDCVNAVGVDVNTASVPLLTRISGLNATLAATSSATATATAPSAPRRAEESAAPRRQDLRASRRLPAHAERRQPARRLLGAPGSLPGGRKASSPTSRSRSRK
jgi:uncharacterized protein